MKVLWLCSTPVKAITDSLGLEPAVLGGWMNGAYGDVVSEGGIELMICYPQTRCRSAERADQTHSSSVGFFWRGGEKAYSETVSLFEGVLKDFMPDVIHIFGTEHEYGAALAQAASGLGLKTRISASIQGLVSIYASQFLPDFDRKELRRASISELKNRCSLQDQQSDYYRRGEYENRLIACASVVMGRTQWDEACCRLVNPGVTYRHVGESLRDEFYAATPGFDPSSHRIFFSQGGKPIKAMHRLVEALPLIARAYPDVRVAVSGASALRDDRLRGLTYDRYLARRMRELGVEDRFEFLGVLGPERLIDEMGNSAVFVSTSSIENSPNSMGEAMILGLPCVASYVGGVPSIAKDGEEALLFAYNDTEMLARHVIWAFDHPDDAAALGAKGRQRALKNHSREANRGDLLAVYREIAGCEGK